MTTTRDELFQAWAATDPSALLFPTVSFAVCASVFILALVVVLLLVSGETCAQMAMLPLERDEGGRR